MVYTHHICAEKLFQTDKRMYVIEMSVNFKTLVCSFRARQQFTLSIRQRCI